MVLSSIVVPNYYKPLSKVSGSSIILVKDSDQNPRKPMSITLNGLTNEIPIKTGHFDKGEWELSKNEALYLESSGLPGKKGNIVIYGHNSKQVFSTLFDQKVGGIISLKSDKGEVFFYRVEQIQNVFPTDVSILSQQTEDQKLTLFTCTGLFDSMRLVITAKRV